jgi:hypothetical protein
MKIDDILAKAAKVNMVQFELEAFKRDFPSLYKTFVQASLEVAEKSWYDGRDSIGRDGEQCGSFEDFKKEILQEPMKRDISGDLLDSSYKINTPE